jgi:signal transduction histidine kinase
MVMLLMAAVSVTLSERVLTRLSQNQEAYLQGLAGSYLDGVAASVSPSVLRRDSWEIYDALLRMKPQKASVLARETVVTDANDIILASDKPEAHRTLELMDDAFRGEFEDSQMRLDTNSELAFQIRPISHRAEMIGKVYVVFDASSLLQERRDVLLELLLTNGLLTIFLAVIGFLVVRRMVRPMQILESHLQTAASGGLEPISGDEFPKAGREAKRIFSAFNRLVSAEKDREELVDRLTKEERLASLGRLASGMAHEINNPLGGLLNAADTLKKHGHREKVRLESVDLIRRGLLGIRDVVQAALATYRPERSSRALTRQDLSDVALLVSPELKSRSQGLKIVAQQSLEIFAGLPAGPMRQAIMNLVLNASKASPDGAEIVLTVDRTEEAFCIHVQDQGHGLPEAAAQILNAPLKSRVPDGTSGLGLWVVRQIADELEATLSVRKNKPRGMMVTMVVPHRQAEALHAAA